ncbi:hypothetical protein ACLOJK_006940, partial [Asimina triloba]
TASDQSAAVVAHGRKPICPIHDKSPNSNGITIIGQKTHESTMTDRFPPDLQQINGQILVRQRASIKLKPQPSSTSSLDPVASSIEQSKAVRQQD